MRKSTKPLVLAAIVAAFAAGPVLADGDGGDNSMSPRYGDSWADLEAHNPEAAPVPSMASHQDAAHAQATWDHARDSTRERMHHWRDDTSNMFHRNTGNSPSSDARPANDMSTTSESSGTGRASSGPGPNSTGSAPYNAEAAPSSTGSAPYNAEAAPPANGGQGMAPGPAATGNGGMQSGSGPKY